MGKSCTAKLPSGVAIDFVPTIDFARVATDFGARRTFRREPHLRLGIDGVMEEAIYKGDPIGQSDMGRKWKSSPEFKHGSPPFGECGILAGWPGLNVIPSSGLR